MPHYCEPATIEEVQEIFRSASSVRLVGSGTKVKWDRVGSWEGVLVSTRRLTGIVEWFPDDLVVTVRAGMEVGELQGELACRGQWLPIPPADSFWQWVSAGMPGTIGGLVSTRLPTRWDFWTNGVRYWVLGMKVVLPDGSLLRCGSRAVKNVAGYDMHKLFTGAWGSLGLIAEVTLRLFPKPGEGARGYPEQIILGPGAGKWLGEGPLFLGRVLRKDLRGFLERLESPYWIGDAMTGTFWAWHTPWEEVGWGLAVDGEGRWSFLGIQNKEWMVRLKEVLDPGNKLRSPLDGVL